MVDGFAVGFKHDKPNDFKEMKKFYNLRLCTGGVKYRAVIYLLNQSRECGGARDGFCTEPVDL